MEVGSAPPGTAAEKQENVKLLENKQAANDRAKGADVFQFDPKASPEEKAAQAKKAIPAGLNLPKPSNGVNGNAGLATQTNGATVNGNETTTNGSSTNGNATNGNSVPKSPVLTEPASPKMVNGLPQAGDGEWSRTGWEPRFGSLNDALGMQDAITDHQTALELHLDDKFFGDWYHNAGVIIFACLATWIITLLRGGIAWIILIMACCGTYYRTSIRRVRRNVRDDLNREFSKQKLATDVESLEWINMFTVKFWPIYQPVLAATVINIVDGILANATPAFLDSLRMTTFTLGTKPPRIDFVRTYPKTEDDILEMDWKFSFTPNDTSDLTSLQLKNKVNPKVVLEIRVGKGIASKGIPIVVEDMSFSGVMKVKIKLQLAFPHIEKVDICFLEKPEFDFVLKPLGGETFGIDIGFLPGLSGFIKDQVHTNLGPMLYAPNMLTLEIAKMMGGASIDQAIGVLLVTVHHAQGLKKSDAFSGTPDPYVLLSINNSKEVGRTKHMPENSNPRWNETFYIIINSFHEALNLGIFDYNDIRKDGVLGSATFAMESLETNPEQENVALPILLNTKQKGEITCDFRFFPVLEGKKLEDGTIEPVPETNTGILKLTISQAKDLDHTKSMIGQLTPYAAILIDNKKVHQTRSVKRNNNPAWGESKDILISNRKRCVVGLQIKDDREIASDPSLGTWQMKLEDLLEQLEKGNNWFNLSHTKSGRINISAQWKPVAMKGGPGGGGYTTPIGVMRFHFKSGKDLKNLERVGKSDPYCRVMVGGVQKGRTVTFENDLNPEWDEVLYVPVRSPKEKITLEVMDQENLGSDRSMGQIHVNCADYIHENERGEYLEHSERLDRSEGLVRGNKGTPKGILNYTAAFYPCLNVSDPEDEEEEGKEKEEAEAANPERKPSVVGEEEQAVAPLSPSTDVPAEETGKKSEKLRLTPEELLTYNQGLLICNLIEGEMSATDCYLEIVMDDMLYPAFSTAKIRSRHTKFQEIGDAFVRELDVSKVTLRLRASGKDHDDEDSIIAKLPGQTLETLKQCLNNPTKLALRTKDGDVSRVTISLKYIPVAMKLDPSESINNMGTIRVDVMDAANLRAVDRGGKSDPYCVFEMNGEKVFKSNVIKKNLHPAWNEFFETKVQSRTAADFKCTVYDWDLAGDSDFLGQTSVDMTGLEPFKPQIVVLKLSGKKGEEGKLGEIRLRLLFKPDYVIRSRQGSSTFSGTFATPGKIVTGVAGAPLKGVSMAAGGIGKGASFISRGFRGRSKKDSTGGTTEEEGEVRVGRPMSNGDEILLQVPAGSSADQGPKSPTTPSRDSLSAEKYHSRSKSQSSVHSASPARPTTAGSSGEQGVAGIQLISASGFPPGANVRGRIRVVGPKQKEILKSKSIKNPQGEITWDESCTVNCAADQQFSIYVEDDHLFRDQALGEGFFFVDDTGTGRDTVVKVGEGQVVLKTSFKPNGDGGSPKAGSGRRFLGKK